MTTFSPELDRIGGALQRVAAERAQHRVARRRRRRVSLLATGTALFAAAAALAGGVDLRGVLPGYSVAQTPVVSPEQVAASLSPPVSPQALGALRLISNVDLSQLHEARSDQLGVTVLVAPRTTGGACAIFIQAIAMTTQCGDAAALERGMPIINDEATLYVGMRPDGVSTVTAVDGTSVPVTDNVFISDKPIAP